MEELEDVARSGGGADPDVGGPIEAEQLPDGEKKRVSASLTRASRSAGTGRPACTSRTRSTDAAIASSIGRRASSGALASRASRPDLIFSQMRGTAKKKAGRTFGR